jgi:hypothetical protein
MFNEILSKLIKDEILEDKTNASFKNPLFSMCLVTHSKKSMQPFTQIFRSTIPIIPFKSGKQPYNVLAMTNVFPASKNVKNNIKTCLINFLIILITQYLQRICYGLDLKGMNL